MRRFQLILSALLVGVVVVSALAAPAEARKKPRPSKHPRPAATAKPSARPSAAPTATPSAGVIASTIAGCDNLTTDMGRPVCEIANELGVPAAVFREAFSHVTPAAKGTEPSDAQRESNHQILLNALTPYGVTPAKLDAVSDKYRL